MNNTKAFNVQNHRKIAYISILALIIFIQGCNNREFSSYMKYEKQEEEIGLNNQETTESTNDTNKPSIFSCIKNTCNKLNPFAKNIDPKSRVILGCGQNLENRIEYSDNGEFSAQQKKHTHKGFWTIDTDNRVNPDFCGYAEDGLKELDDNSCTSIISEHLPYYAYTPNFFKLISQKLKHNCEFTLWGSPSIIMGDDYKKLILNYKDSTIKTIDFNNNDTLFKNFEDELFQTDNINNSLEKYNLHVTAEKKIEAYFEAEYNFKLSKIVLNPFTNQEVSQAFLENQTNPSLKSICKIFYYAYLGRYSAEPKLVFIKI